MQTVKWPVFYLENVLKLQNFPLKPDLKPQKAKEGR